ncbi:hypothetical protein UFOVP1151_45 [uncultured Caudovirales phage]|uniref:Uncharacterized protein n=1 Tax=uncultured Caudovirales phage TaxID=2100421 RepID=A0A6J5R129_9CAUD|nr:hypothetical protein UFOVP1151_45 [uncultured Caudovirales phage]
MNLEAKQYLNTNYIILSDGRVARLLKPTKIHQQTYINFIIEKKMKRVNTQELSKMFAEADKNGVQY